MGDEVFVLLAMKLNFGNSFTIDGKDFIFLIAFHVKLNKILENILILGFLIVKKLKFE